MRIPAAFPRLNPRTQETGESIASGMEQTKFHNWSDALEARDQNFYTWEEFKSVLPLCCKNPKDTDKNPCGESKTCTFCKVDEDTSKYKPDPSSRRAIGIALDALLKTQKEKQWWTEDPAATMQAFFDLVAGQGLPPETKPAIKNYG